MNKTNQIISDLLSLNNYLSSKIQIVSAILLQWHKVDQNGCIKIGLGHSEIHIGSSVQ